MPRMNKEEKKALKQELADISRQARSLPNKESRNALLESLKRLDNSIVSGGKFENNLTVEEAEIFLQLSGLVLKVAQATNSP